MLRRLARAIVFRYPQPWRERYEDEVLALIEDLPVRFGDFGELMRGLLVERARALIEDADHPARTSALLASLQPAFVIAFMAFAWGIGLALRGSFGGLRPERAEMGTWVIIGFCGAYLMALVVFLFRRRCQPFASQPLLPAWAGLLLLPVLFVGIVLTEWGNSWAGWTDTPSELGWLVFFARAWLYGTAIAELSSAFWPGRRMLQAIGQVAGAENQLKWAQRWVDGCHTMIAQGVPSPLEEAQGQVARFCRERQVAFEQLQQLGYKARFRQ